MRRRNAVLIGVVGILVLACGLWSLNNSLFHLRIEEIETFQVYDVMGNNESRGWPVYVHPNKGVGPVEASFDLTIRVDYKNVNGTLQIDDYYSDFGRIIPESMHKLDHKVVSGNGSAVFEIEHNYVGLHYIFCTPDYVPGYNPPIEVWIYTIHYEPKIEKEMVFYSFTLSLLGTILVSTGITITILRSKVSH